MDNNRLSLKEWVERLILKGMLKKYKIFDPVTIEVKNFESDGLILDIGGGGEGVIGRLKGKQVVAIDLYQDELDEAPDGPQKIVMDARKMTFPDGNFNTATAFFSMMYMKTRSDHEKVLREAWRVLKPGGRLYLWDVDISKYATAKKEAYFVPLHYLVGNFKNRTGYGVKWPDQIRDESYYIELARETGFLHLGTERNRHVFFLIFSRQ